MAADNFKDFLNMAEVVKHFREISREAREHLLRKLTEEHSDMTMRGLPKSKDDQVYFDVDAFKKLTEERTGHGKTTGSQGSSGIGTSESEIPF